MSTPTDQLEQNPQFPRLLLAHLYEALVGVDASLRITLFNRSAERLFGYERERVLGKRLDSLLPRSMQGHAHPQIERFLSEDVRARFMGGGRTIEGVDAHGQRLALEGTLVKTHDFGDQTVAVAVLRDVAEPRKIDQALKQAAHVFASTREGVMITDPDIRIISVNKAFCEITGYAEDEVINQTPGILSSGRHDPSFYQGMWQSLQETGEWKGEIWNRRKSGEIYPEWLTINAVTGDSGEVVNYVGVFSDITRIKEAEAHIDRLAHYDPCTDLPNRLLLMSRLDQAIQRCHRRGKQGALLVCNLDRFRMINETLGHAAGDQVVRAVANQIQSRLAREHSLAHLRGDEFAVLIEELTEGQEAARLAEAIGEAVGEDVQVAGESKVRSSLSTGIAVFPDDGDDAGAVMQAADTAVHRAKEEGRGGYRFYDEGQTTAARERFRLEVELRRALAQEEFILHYQPFVDAADGRIRGAEALVRWMHPERGLVAPSQFIPVAEETGLIDSIGDWVLDRACREAVPWYQQAGETFVLSVNLSPREYQDPQLVARLERTIAETAFPAQALSLEITETSLMASRDATAHNLAGLKALGASVAIDDFGTGYSSLAYLKRLRANTLKIDRSFIKDLPDDHDSAQIVAAIIAMVRGLGIDIVAEGVETEGQRRLLHELGCKTLQGNLACPPIDAKSFGDLLSKQAPLLTPLGVDAVP